MLEAYSLNIEVNADSVIPFNNISIEKGCSSTLITPGTIQLNKKGVYMVSVDAVAGTSTTVQLEKDGVLQPQAQSTGTNLSFTTLVQVPKDNSCCCVISPTTLKVLNSTAGTFANINLVITKVC